MNLLVDYIKNLFKRNDEYSVSDYTIINLPGPEWKDWNTTQATKEGLKDNGWIYRSIQIISQIAASVDFVVYNSDDEILWEHPLTILLNNPQPSSEFFPKSVFFELVVNWLYLSGIAPIHKILNGQGRTQELNLISPDRITYIRDNGIPTGYGVDLEGTHNFVNDDRVNLETIIPMRFPDPSDPYSGISPLMVAGQLVDTMSENRALNKSVAQNRGVMDGILTFSSDVSEHQMNAVREKIKETFRQNRKSGYPNVLGGNPSYIRMGLNQLEMGLIAQNKANREEILTIFGIPPQVMGLEGTIKYDNFISSLRVLGATTIIPLLSRITDTLTASFQNELNEGEWIGYEASNTPALSQDDDQKSQIVHRYAQMGIPLSQLNSKFQLGLESFEGWDLPFNGLKKSGYLANYQQYEMDQRNDDIALTQKKNGFLRILEQQYTDLINELGQESEPLEKAILEDKVWAALGKTEEQLLNYYEKVIIDFTTQAWQVPNVVFDNSRSIEKRAIELTDTILKYIDDEALALNDVTGIQLNTARNVMNIVSDGYKAGDNMNVIAEKIQQRGLFSDDRALLWARTLLGSAQSIAQIGRAKDLGATHKTWRTADDEHVRPMHEARDGETRPIDAYFSGGIRFPGDPNASPDDRLNCRCPTTYIIGDPEDVTDIKETPILLGLGSAALGTASVSSIELVLTGTKTAKIINEAIQTIKDTFETQKKSRGIN